MAADTPNVIFIFADQLGSTYMGCYGHPQVRTPNLDAFARTGVRYETAYTVAPLCTPFRGTLFTGRYPCQTGIFRNSQGIGPGETTLAALYNEAGYATAYVGKWHLADQPRQIWVPPESRGDFTDFVGWDCGHARHLNQKYFDGDSPEELTLQGHETDALTDIAIERLERHAAGEAPFCLFVSYQAPHPYCEPPAAYLDLYQGQPLATRPTVDPEARFRGYGHDHSEVLAPREWTERYFGEITHLDAAVGRLLQALDDLGRRDDTVIVFTSDHGDQGGSHGRFEKSVSYEEACRIPVLLAAPGIAGDRVMPDLFSSVDFLPTLLGLCGLPACPHAAGVDHSPRLRGEAATPPRTSVIMQLADWACIRRGDSKLTLDLEGTTPQTLFDLSADPYEEYNRVSETDAQATAAPLAEEYRTWLSSLE